MKTADKIARLIRQADIEIAVETDNRILGDALEHLEKSRGKHSADIGREKWRIIMKSPITKLAAAAVVIIAALAGLHFLGGSADSLAFAEVVEPLINAKTATFKGTISGQGIPPQEFDGMFMVPGKMRQTQSSGGVVVVDLEKGQMLTLVPQAKQAILVEVVNAPEEPGGLNFFEEIRMRIASAQPFEDESVEFLGEEQVEGRTAIGYHVKKQELDATVWADRETKMPIRIEVVQEPMTVTMSNIVFDVQLDESLFSLEIPDGYSVKKLRQNLAEPTEEDFVESFRIWCEHMDGKLPSVMERSALNEFMKYQREKLKAKGVEPSLEDVMRLQQTILDMTRGFMFYTSLPANGDWRYVGKDVKFGDSTAAIFWYRPEGSSTYRVIYGDLSVKEVEPEDLPK
ncbi:MAG: LolA family protein [Planctomycetota bacterium]|jgi:outer membrane lipoprotein-sorting protein